MREATVWCLSIALLVMSGCKSPSREPLLQVVVLVDVSGSIDPKGREQMFDAVGGLVSLLRRGDCLAIIPITRSAGTSSQGTILRYEVPVRRESYDSDLRKIQTRVRADLERLDSESSSSPGTNTDLLGSVQLAEEEFNHSDNARFRVLVVLSDLIQDDSQFDFKRDRRLSTSTMATLFGSQIAETHPLRGAIDALYVGSLLSLDLQEMSSARRLALVAFWKRYLQASGVEPDFATDGCGLLRAFILRTRDQQMPNRDIVAGIP